MFDRRFLLASMSAIGALSASEAGAQTAPSTPTSTVGEVVVTAQKRSENLQNVPISLSVLGGSNLEKTNTDDFAKVARMVPGISFIDLGPGQSQLSIRGVTTGGVARDDTARKESVGVYLNEIPVSVALFNPDLDTYDLNRVEILRGPQGTLYGAGSMSGTVRLITNEANTHSYDAKAELKLSQTQDSRKPNAAVKGAVNIPVIEGVLGVRLVGYDDYDDGYIDDIGQHKKDVNTVRKYGARLSAIFTPTPELKITPTILLQKIETGGYPLQDVQSILGTTTSAAVASDLPAPLVATPDSIVPGRLLIGDPVGGPYTQFRQRPEGLNDDFKVFSLQGDYDFGPTTLTTTTSYLRRDLSAKRDLTYFMESLFGSAFNYMQPLSDLLDQTSLRTLTQEVRLASNGPGRFQYVTGVFYQHEQRNYTQSIFSPGFQTLTGIPTNDDGLAIDTLYIGQFHLQLRQYAWFGEASYAVTDQLKATLGLRWFDYTQTRATLLRGLFNGGVATSQQTSTQANGFNPKALISYKVTPDVMISAQASRGFKLGGPSDPVPGICTADAAAAGVSGGDFKPEKLWNYELGAKTSWANGRLIVNGDVFQIDYDDLQLNRRLPCSFTVTTNGGRAKSQGVELEITARPSDWLTLSLGTAYTHARILTDEPSLNARAGDQLPLSPRFTLNAAVDVSRPITDDVEGYAGVSVQHVSSVIAFFNSPLPGSPPVDPFGSRVGPYTLVNLRIGARFQGYDLSLFADNLLDERAAISIDRERVGFLVDGGVGRDTRLGLVRNRPRTVGVNASFKF